MKDSLKIALGIFLGVLALLACVVCVVAGLTAGGVAFLDSLLSTQRYEPLPATHPVVPAIATSTPPSGHITQCNDLGLALLGYMLSDTCPSGYGRPAEGTKFIIVRIRAENFTSDLLELPDIEFTLDGYEPTLGSTGDCIYDPQAFGNACWQWGGRLFPEVACEGWELFEVPLAFDPTSATLHALFSDYATGVSCDAQWPLEPPSP